MDRKFTEELIDKRGEMSSIYQGIANYNNNKEPFFTCCSVCICLFVFINSTRYFLQTDSSCIVADDTTGKKCWEVIW